IRFQRYEFVHSARYLRITYQIARNKIVGKHRLRVYEYDVEREETGQMLYEDVYEEGDRGIKDIYIDLGVPTYRTISVDLRLGHKKQWGAATKRYRFRIPRVVQTDFKSQEVCLLIKTYDRYDEGRIKVFFSMDDDGNVGRITVGNQSVNNMKGFQF